MPGGDLISGVDAPVSYASELLDSMYEVYTGSDGQQHKTRVATASMEFVVKATDGKVVTIKFDKNFTKKHLFTYTKKDITSGKSIMNMSIDEVKELPTLHKQANDAKLLKQAKHRTGEEQRLQCKHCDHEEKRHKTGSGNPAAQCKDKAPDGVTPCPCTTTNPFEAQDAVALYEKNRSARNKPTANPLAGATTAKTTYIIMNEIPRTKFENTVADAILAQPTWDPGGEHIDWDFNKPGCVITVDTTQPSSSGAKAKGATVSVKDITTDALRPTYQVYHFNGTL